MILYLKWLAALLLLAASIQYIITKIEEAKHPAPGQMVDVGGYKLHINIQGEGSGPTVVLDMGLGGSSLYWSLVQPEIAKFAKVVSYDRAGLGWSDKSHHPKTNENIVKELHELLQKANVPGPYVLVGHSFAGIIARVFANKYPGEVAGVVLVDSSHENQMDDLPKSSDFLARVLRQPQIYPFINYGAKIGLVRLYNLYNYKGDKFDKATHKAMFAKESNTKFIDALLEETRLFESNLEEAKANKYNLQDIPLIVITAAMEPSKEACAMHGHATEEICQKAYVVWHSLQKDLVTKSTNGKQIKAYNSGHIVQQDEPHIIVEAVREMLN